MKVLPKLACSRLKHDSFSIKVLTFLDDKIAAYLSLINIVTLEHHLGGVQGLPRLYRHDQVSPSNSGLDTHATCYN